MAVPQQKEQQKTTFPAKLSKEPTSIEELAAQMAASKGMAKMDFLPGVVDGMFKNLETMVSIFNEKTRRQQIEDADLPKEEKRLPDMTDIKMIFDAQAAAVQAEITLREEQRKEIMWARATQKEKGDDRFDFGGKKKADPKPRPSAA